MGTKVDLTGRKFGKLTALEDVGLARKGRLWKLSCECGGETVRVASKLLGNSTKNSSCRGCEYSRRSNARSQHGAARGGKLTHLYRVWRNLLQRCYNAHNVRFYRYGARGITVCREWLDFAGFRDWAYSNGYTTQTGQRNANTLTIDRVNVDLGYDPSNCEWVTLSENSRRNSRLNPYWRSITCDA